MSEFSEEAQIILTTTRNKLLLRQRKEGRVSIETIREELENMVSRFPEYRAKIDIEACHKELLRQFSVLTTISVALVDNREHKPWLTADRKNDWHYWPRHMARHTLYKQYLHILEGFTPPVFVMENVRGLLSATLSGRFTLELIIRDLRHAGPGYHIYSLSSGEEVSEGSDFRQLVISAEKYGVPQIRKRLFILGIRKDLGLRPLTLSPCRSVTTGEAIGDLRIVRSGITKTIDILQNWLAAIESIRNNLHGTPDNVRRRLLSRLDQLPSFWEQEHACGHSSSATSFADQMKDPNLNDFPQHLPRKNMPSDLRRYFYAAVYGEITGRSPHLQDFPRNLLPDHKNIRENPGSAVFNDRFRVQLRDKPSSTVTAHIRKDGNYYIHYDPLQCRSLTVREAARLQSFPDNYFLEGNRTEQYQQIGNAVPPLLARKIAAIVADILDRMKWPTS